MILAENDDKEDENSGKWSDRALMNKYGKITAIGIEEERDGDYIQKMRARCLLPPPLIPPSRYGRVEEGWSQWRKVFGRQQVFGSHEKLNDSLSLRESPPLVQSSLAFTHLYGVEDHPYAHSVCFNIE